MKNIYYIGGPWGAIAEYKANTRLNADGSIRGIYYSAIAGAQAATLYFTDRRVANKCLKSLSMPESLTAEYYLGPEYRMQIKRVKRLGVQNLHEIKKGYFISKNTLMYKKLRKGDEQDG